MKRAGFFHRGRRFPTQHASAPPPAIVLTLQEDGALRAIRMSGDAGLPIGAGVSISTAIRLAMLGHAVIDQGSPQRLRTAGPTPPQSPRITDHGRR
jgi:hypothetical protein